MFTRYSENDCGSQKITSVTPKRFFGNINSWKIGNLCSEKKILAFFFSYNRVIEYEKSQRTLCKSAWGSLSFTAEVKRSNFEKSKRLLKTNFWKEGQTFQWKKDFGLFSRIIECDKPPGTFCKSPKGIPTITVEVITSLLQHLRSCWKTQSFEKKCNLSSEGKFLAFFFRIIEHGKRQSTTYKGTQGTLTSFLQTIWSFL